MGVREVIRISICEVFYIIMKSLDFILFGFESYWGWCCGEKIERYLREVKFFDVGFIILFVCICSF